MAHSVTPLIKVGLFFSFNFVEKFVFLFGFA